ncbi:tsp-16 [Pristionchus pacificus]|uniref:Tsp-16 n=1 Tax=Pristionchus pacificus TaxID=54126 RepID=A0A2A6BD93_PRIPA|nr:tsp-16 [Pristionchus pacificus]|eukprot:PDM63855.1 tsp-16 [Pristionchus pacificus]
MNQGKVGKSTAEKMEERYRRSRSTCIALSAVIMLSSFTIFTLMADALHKFSYVTSLLGTNVFVYVVTIAFFLGIVILFFVSLFALFISSGMIYSLVTYNQSLFTMLTFSTLTVGSMGILAAILGFCLHAELRGGVLRDWMAEGLKREYGHPQDYHVTNAWDRLQSEMKCCGVEGGSEWISSDWYLGQVKYPRRRRPASCCKSCSEARQTFCIPIFESLTPSEWRACNELASVCPSSGNQVEEESVCSGNKLGPEELPVETFVHVDGCFPFLESRLRFYSIALITEGILLALLLFSQTISAFVLNYYADPLLGNYDAVNTLE